MDHTIISSNNGQKNQVPCIAVTALLEVTAILQHLLLSGVRSFLVSLNTDAVVTTSSVYSLLLSI
jgi:hypothetical protein